MPGIRLLHNCIYILIRAKPPLEAIFFLKNKGVANKKKNGCYAFIFQKKKWLQAVRYFLSLKDFYIKFFLIRGIDASIVVDDMVFYEFCTDVSVEKIKKASKRKGIIF